MWWSSRYGIVPKMGATMTNTERKARQLVAVYGVEMALMQASFFNQRASGAMKSWWYAVQNCIQRLAAQTAAA
jgi:hypothetical protein